MEAGAHLGTVSTATTALLQRQDDEWEEQLRHFEEVERWEKVAKKNLPDDLRVQFLEYLSNYSAFWRMPVFKMMDTLQWDHTRLVELFAVLTKVPRDTMTPLVTLMESFVPYNIVLVCLYLLHALKDYQVEELVMHTEHSDAHLFVQVCRHLPSAELEHLVGLAERLSIRDIIALLKRCDEPLAKHCALCRTRRLHDLEQRMLNEQVPDGMIKVPGTLPLYAKETIWSADDEKGFNFNMETAEICWYKYPVDLVQICDKCLLDVNQSITNNRRFEEFQHLDPPIRKGVVRQLRDHEKGMAEVIHRISHERNYRRGREWALRALKHQRAGLTREEKDRDIAARAEAAARLLQQKQQEHDALVALAVAVDEKWIVSDQAAEGKRLEQRQAYAEMKQRFEYSYPERKAPKERIHARTWELAPISDEGKALLPEGAAKLFGTHEPVVANHDAELADWKAQVDVSHGAYLQRQEEIRLAKRAALQAEIDRLCNHVRERMAQIELNKELARKQQEKDEKERRLQRAADRVARREKRFEEYMEAERRHMVYEDHRSYELRDYEWQLLHEQSEREDMFNEYCEQTAFDRFWGLDLYERMQCEEEARLRKVYEDRVVYYNDLMVQTRSVKPAKQHYSLRPVGSLPEDSAYETERQRREAVIKKLKAEEVRSKLRVRVSYSYK